MLPTLHESILSQRATLAPNVHLDRMPAFHPPQTFQFVPKPVVSGFWNFHWGPEEGGISLSESRVNEHQSSQTSQRLIKVPSLDLVYTCYFG